MLSAVLSVFFFFFQAEDGIRDWSVTGVQTCALPIYRSVMREVEAQPVGCHHRPHLAHMGAEDLAQRRVHEVRGGVVALDVAASRFVRSEERRVGKEGRSRWSREH